MATSNRSKNNRSTVIKDVSVNIEETCSNDSTIRVQEKEELQNLNDRFALYIEHVRKINHSKENDYSNISIMSLSKCQIDSEIDHLKDIYEYELNDARNLIDELTSERANLLITNQNLNDQILSLNDKILSNDVTIGNLEKSLKISDEKLNECENKISSFKKKIGNLSEELKEKTKLIERNDEKIQQLKEDVNNKTLLWSAADNKLKSLKEVLEFDRHVHRKEVEELKKSLRYMESEFESLKNNNCKDLDYLLSDKLAELRQGFENEAYQTKLEIEKEFHERITYLCSQNDRLLTAHNMIQEENNELRNIINQNKGDLSDANIKLSSAEFKIKQLEDVKQELTESYRKLTNDYESLSKDQNKQLHQLIVENQQMATAKVALDLEIAAYRKLLESEEERLTIQTKLNDSVQNSPTGRPTKRSRKIFESSPIKSAMFESDVRIASIDIQNRKFIRILNKSTKDQDVTSWKIRCLNGEEIQEYKFTARKLKSNSITTVWASGCGMTKVIGNDHIAKEIDIWSLSENSKVLLLNEGETIIHEFIPQIVSTQRRNLAKEVRSEKCTMC